MVSFIYVNTVNRLINAHTRQGNITPGGYAPAAIIPRVDLTRGRDAFTTMPNILQRASVNNAIINNLKNTMVNNEIINHLYYIAKYN